MELVHGDGGDPRLVTAWQAGRTAAEGTGQQWLFKAETSGVLPSSSPLVWSPNPAGPHREVAGDGVRPAWSPTLFEDPHEPGRVWLLYDEGAPRNGSVQHTGGSVYAKLSTDGGLAFGPPRLVLGYDVWGGVDKVTIDQVRVAPDGKWLLAFNSQCTGVQHSLSLRDSDAPLCATGVLASENRGENWTMLEGVITDVASIADYQEATLELCSATRWLMLFRTTKGFIYKSTSTDSGSSWAASVPTTLLNPHSRVNLLARRGGDESGGSRYRELLLAYNPSKTLRQPLSLARSNTCGETWEYVKDLYSGHGSYPTMVQVGEDLVTTFTRDGKGVGIGAAVTRLPPPMSFNNTSTPLKSDDRGPPAWPPRAVSFWYDATNASTAYSPRDGAAMLAKVAAHKELITSVILFCGITVAPGGKVVGTLSDGCTKTLIPGLLSLGVRVEGTVEAGTCDITDYRALFTADPQPLADRLAALGKAHNLSGWNMDLEPQIGKPGKTSTAPDAALYASWASKVAPTLHASGMRLTADAAGWTPMIKDFSTLAKGFDRLMDMDTYNSASLAKWDATFGRFATGAPSAPLSARSVGLGCWADNRSCTGCPNITATLPWSLSAQSATDRICAVMNASAPEVSFWVLAGLAPSPQDFWWPALRRYRAGGGCAIPTGAPLASAPRLGS